MKIAFVDTVPWDYIIDAPDIGPLGGAQSTLCYLARNLADLGQDISLFNHTKHPGTYQKVHCYTISESLKETLNTFDVVITLTPNIASYLTGKLKGKLILWTGHAYDQPAVVELKEKKIHDLFDYIVVKSHWQKEQYHTYFKIAQEKIHFFHNAIGPSFENLFKDEAELKACKKQEISLAYTSTPFRGLEILISIFPLIKKIIPQLHLKIFSSMKVYQIKEQEDTYSHLYQKCQNMDGVDYIGSLKQPELAQRLKSVSILAYPNTFPETCSTAVMEALASGCMVVASDLGALAETTYGFAHLIPVTGNWEEYAFTFVEKIVRILKTTKDYQSTYKQVAFMNKSCTWKVRSNEWIKWLKKII